jgi:phenylacetate-coenzyme A ligase PaaK-like adenylate-forming protein
MPIPFFAFSISLICAPGHATLSELMTDTRTALDAVKEQKFRALVRHADAHAPYYANIIRERGLDVHTCTAADFPVLTKSILMANFDDIVTDRRITKQVVADFLTRSSDPKDLLFNEFTVVHTSGTSGEVGYFLYAPADLARMSAAMMRSRNAFRGVFPGLRLRLRRIRIAFYGATGGHFAGVTGVTSMQRGLRRLFLDARAFEVNTPLPDVVQQLNEFQPDVLFGYTTALKMLGEEQRAGRLRLRPAAVSATGEMVTKSDMQFLSEAFGGALTSSMYACTEHMMMGLSNPDRETMTLTDDNLAFEFYEDHSIITNLFNHTMPMIRYRMSDILRPVSPPDTHPTVIRNLVGRTEQMPIFVNGEGTQDFISPHTINEIFVKGVTRFQMQITGLSSFRFPICVEPALDSDARAAAAAAVRSRLTDILRQKGLGNVTFEVPIVADIPLNERTRKFQLIVARHAGDG